MKPKRVLAILMLAASPVVASTVRVDCTATTPGRGVYATLAEATAVLKDGDELLIDPGVYRETLKLHGRRNIVVKATGPGTVIDGSLSFSGNQITAVGDQSDLFEVKMPQGHPKLIRADGKLLKPLIDKKTRDEYGGFGQGAGPLTARDTDLWYWNPGEKILHLNFSSHAPPKDLEVTGRDSGVELLDCNNVHIQGLTIRNCSDNIFVEGGVDNVIQQCVISSGMNGIMLRSKSCVVRFNTIVDNDRYGIAGGGQRNSLEQNLLERNGQNVYATARFYIGGIKRNHGSFEVVDYNLILDEGGASYWGDLDCIANLVYGNVAARSSTNGFYIEWTQRQNNISFNTAMDCGSGIMFRCSQENVIRRNWFFDTSTVSPPAVTQGTESDAKPRRKMLGVSFLDTTIIDGTEANIVDDNLIQVSGDAVTVSGHDENNALAAGDTGFKDGGPVYNFALTNQLLGNYYTRPTIPVRFGQVFGKPIASLEEMKQKTGWEAAAHTGSFSPEVIWHQSPVWWPVPDKTGVLWVPVILNGDLSLRDRGNSNDGPMGWQPSVWNNDLIEWKHWSRYGGVTPTGDGNQSSTLAWHKTDARDHGNYLEAIGLNSHMQAGGLGWRGLLLPVLPGTSFSASVELKTLNIKPLSGGGTVKAGILFTDSVGTLVGQVWLNSPGATSPDKWTTLRRDINVPANATRLQWFLGLDAVEGTADFAAVNISNIHTGQPGGAR